eukprot:scaffold154333_cov36-Tisochrysis_lutea.AAC.3
MQGPTEAHMMHADVIHGIMYVTGGMSRAPREQVDEPRPRGLHSATTPSKASVEHYNLRRRVVG